MEETDILKLLDNAVCSAGAFGFGTSQINEETKAVETLNEYLEQTDIGKEDLYEVETLIGSVLNASETVGFKRGFGVAIRCIMEGLNAGKK